MYKRDDKEENPFEGRYFTDVQKKRSCLCCSIDIPETTCNRVDKLASIKLNDMIIKIKNRSLNLNSALAKYSEDKDFSHKTIRMKKN